MRTPPRPEPGPPWHAQGQYGYYVILADPHGGTDALPGLRFTRKQATAVAAALNQAYARGLHDAHLAL